MEAILDTISVGLPVLIAHFITTIAVFCAAAFIYVWITPYKEISLIKSGNIPAAVSLGGALIGLAIPLAFCLAGSVSVYDIILWGGITLALQLLIYFIIDHSMSGIGNAIEENKLAPVIFLVSVKISISLINAAAISG